MLRKSGIFTLSICDLSILSTHFSHRAKHLSTCVESEMLNGKAPVYLIRGAAQGVTISEVKNVVWQLPRPQNAVRPQNT